MKIENFTAIIEHLFIANGTMYQKPVMEAFYLYSINQTVLIKIMELCKKHKYNFKITASTAHVFILEFRLTPKK